MPELGPLQVLPERQSHVMNVIAKDFWQYVTDDSEANI
jgi:hypothetical protein